SPGQLATARNWVFAGYDDPAILAGLERRGVADGDLQGADLSGLDLTGSNLAGLDARGASFRGADLTDVRFRDEQRQTNVQFADFRDATVTRRALDQTLNWQLAFFSPERFAELGLVAGDGHGGGHNERLE